MGEVQEVDKNAELFRSGILPHFPGQSPSYLLSKAQARSDKIKARYNMARHTQCQSLGEVATYN